MLNPGGPTAKFAVISVCSEDIALDTFVILSHKEADTSLKRIRTFFRFLRPVSFLHPQSVQMDISVQTPI